jgi:hypothetical protein
MSNSKEMAMRISLRRTSGALCAAALLLAATAVTPAAARGGGGPTDAGGFTNAGDYGAHFSSDQNSSSGGFGGRYGAQRYNAQPGGAYPGYYGGYNCNPAVAAQNPQSCK